MAFVIQSSENEKILTITRRDLTLGQQESRGLLAQTYHKPPSCLLYTSFSSLVKPVFDHLCVR
jgi:hypothetical protein